MNLSQGKYRLSVIGSALAVTEAIFWPLFLIAWLGLPEIAPEFRFEREEILWGLALIPVMSGLFLLGIYLRNRTLRKFADHHLLPFLVPGLSSGKAVAKFIFFRLAFSMFVIALANPQFGMREATAKAEGVDIIVALDVSNSMDAEDFTPSRMERAKMALIQLLQKLHGDRIGLITFAGDAFVHLPVTDDYSLAEFQVSEVSTDLVEKQGTAIGLAIDLALESFDFDNGVRKTIIVVTDGENHEEGALKAAESAKEKGVIVHTIGMGSVKGAPIPVYSAGRMTGFRKDQNNNTVVSKANPEVLMQIAAAGEGMYVQATNSQFGLEALVDELENMEKSEFKTEKFEEYEDRFQVFLFAGLILLLIEFLIADRKSKWANRIHLFGK